MEAIEKFENRNMLYSFLIDGYKFRVLEEKNYPNQMGNFFIDLTSDFFLLKYIKDRNIMTIEIAGLGDQENWFALSFVKDLVYNPDSINGDRPEVDNLTKITELNKFLRDDFEKICSLFNKTNYLQTAKALNEGLRKTFMKRFSGNIGKS